MSEASIVPRVKTETETIQSPISKCGDNWWKDVRVRCAYKGTDLGYRTLPSLGDPAQVEHIDQHFIEEMRGDRDRIAKFVEAHLDKLSDRQRENIRAMIYRANAYMDDAELIWRFWASGFSTPRAGEAPPWPLNGVPQGQVNENIEEGHQRDVDKWKRLIRAALRNLRCAEEVAKKATIREHNKERRKEGRRFGTNGIGGMAPGPDNGDDEDEELPKAQFVPIDVDPEPGGATTFDPGPEPGEDDEDELEEGDIDLEEEPDPGEPPPVVPEEEPEEEEEIIEEEEERPGWIRAAALQKEKEGQHATDCGRCSTRRPRAFEEVNRHDDAVRAAEHQLGGRHGLQVVHLRPQR